MPETYKLVKWVVVTDRSEYVVSERELNAIMATESNKGRFVMLGDVVLNVSFIKEIYKKSETRDSRFSSIADNEKKFLISDNKKLGAGYE